MPQLKHKLQILDKTKAMIVKTPISRIIVKSIEIIETIDMNAINETIGTIEDKTKNILERRNPFYLTFLILIKAEKEKKIFKAVVLDRQHGCLFLLRIPC